MEEQIISFQVAKLAKEKGFVDFKGINHNEIDSLDRNTKVQEFKFYRCYDKNPIMNYQKEAKLIVTTVGSSDIWGLVESYLNPSYITQTNYLAPTQNLLQKWLREKHKIFVTVIFESYRPDCPKFSADVLSLSSKNMGERVLDGFTLYNTYEEALEEGLYQTLLLV